MQAEAQSRFRDHQENLFFRLLISSFVIAAGILPRWFMRFVAYFITLFFIAFTLKNYRAIIANMRTICPGEGALHAALRARRVYLNYAYYLIDLFYISHGEKRLRHFKVNYIGDEILVDAVRSGRGIILMSLHMGNWEIGGIAMAEKGLPPPTIAYFPDSQDIIEKQRNRLRNFSKVRQIELREENFSAIKLLRVLQEGGVVAIQGDRLQYDRGIELEMFGHRALFPKGPVMLASAANALLLPTFMIMSGYNTYDIYVENPLEITVYSKRGETLERNLQALIKIFEKYIKRYPDQWYTFMPFWSKDKKNV